MATTSFRSTLVLILKALQRSIHVASNSGASLVTSINFLNIWTCVFLLRIRLFTKILHFDFVALFCISGKLNGTVCTASH